METEIIKATEFSAYTEILSLSFVPSLEEQETLFTEDYIILEF